MSLPIHPIEAESYRILTEKHIIPELGRHQIDKLQAAHLQSFYAKKLVKLSPRSVQCSGRSTRSSPRTSRCCVPCPTSTRCRFT